MHTQRKRDWCGVLLLLAATCIGWMLLGASSPLEAQRGAATSSSQSSPIFTPAHRSLLEAVRDFFNRHPAPVQPIAYTHKVHLSNGMQCTDCHTSVETGPVAGIPSAQLCMTCHQVVATDKPEIKKLAAYMERGEDIPWQRVYDYSPLAHVKFNHAPHIRAGVDCAKCHGNMKQQTVAVRSVNLTMGYCVNCHKERQVSIDCITCHF